MSPFRGSLLIMITFTSTFAMLSKRQTSLMRVTISNAVVAPEFSK